MGWQRHAQRMHQSQGQPGAPRVHGALPSGLRRALHHGLQEAGARCAVGRASPTVSARRAGVYNPERTD